MEPVTDQDAFAVPDHDSPARRRRRADKALTQAALLDDRDDLHRARFDDRDAVGDGDVLITAKRRIHGNDVRGQRVEPRAARHDGADRQRKADAIRAMQVGAGKPLCQFGPPFRRDRQGRVDDAAGSAVASARQRCARRARKPLLEFLALARPALRQVALCRGGLVLRLRRRRRVLCLVRLCRAAGHALFAPFPSGQVALCRGRLVLRLCRRRRVLCLDRLHRAAGHTLLALFALRRGALRRRGLVLPLCRRRRVLRLARLH